MLITGETIDFTGKNDPLTLLKKIRDSKITLERAKELQEDLNNKKKRKGNKTEEQGKTANLIVFLMEEMKLLNFTMIIIQ